VFASTDEKNAPVRFNDKPYRGKIEVFANTHGSVTVVNVIGLEDYVRGVVPNELSYPALEALKAQGKDIDQVKRELDAIWAKSDIKLTLAAL